VHFKVGYFGRLFRGNGVTSVSLETWGVSLNTHMGSHISKPRSSGVESRLLDNQRGQMRPSNVGGTVDFHFDELKPTVNIERGVIWSVVQLETNDGTSLAISGLTNGNAEWLKADFITFYRRFSTQIISRNSALIDETHRYVCSLLRSERTIETTDVDSIFTRAPKNFWTFDYDKAAIPDKIAASYGDTLRLIETLDEEVTKHNRLIALREAAREIQGHAALILAGQEAWEKLFSQANFISADVVADFRHTWRLPTLPKEYARELVDENLIQTYYLLKRNLASFNAAVTQHNAAWRLRENLRKVEAAAGTIRAFVSELDQHQHGPSYLRRCQVEDLADRLRNALQSWDYQFPSGASSDILNDFYRLREFHRADLASWRLQRNRSFIESELVAQGSYFQDIVPGLTQEQMKAAIVDESACSATTILTARRQLSWPLRSGLKYRSAAFG
jgi:hypothetical protein